MSSLWALVAAACIIIGYVSGYHDARVEVQS